MILTAIKMKLFPVIHGKLLPALTFLAFVHTILSGDVKPKVEKYVPDYRFYHNLTTIQRDLVEIATLYPSFLKIDWTYRSRGNKPQPLLRLTNFTESQSTFADQDKIPKLKVLLSFGEHAREFLPIETMFYLLTNITKGLGYPIGHPAESFSRKILTKVDLFMVGILNPDGRQYVESTQNYCWRGTSLGVDLNRNFDWQFGSKGSSDDVNDEEYRGTHPFSEPECAVLTDITSRINFDAFMSLHSGIRQIYLPYADTVSKRLQRKPENLQNMMELADQMSHATSYTFTYGLAYQLNDYTADGTIFDYMSGIRKIPFALAVELWGKGDQPSSKCFDLFNPRSHELQKSLRELHPMFVTFFQFLILWKQQDHQEMVDPMNDAPPLTFGYILLGFLIVITAIVALHNRLPPCMRPRRRVVSLRSLSSTFSMMGLLKT